MRRKITQKKFFYDKKSPQAEDAFRLRRHSILVGGALRVVLGEVEIILQKLLVTIGSALLELLPVSDTFFGDFFTLLLGRKITANYGLIF